VVIIPAAYERITSSATALSMRESSGIATVNLASGQVFREIRMFKAAASAMRGPSATTTTSKDIRTLACEKYLSPVGKR
jgi:hypothetical protein